jgi:DNA modification methylase
MIMTNSIPFSSITLGERGRSTYNGIEQLAENIRLNGLVQPIVLDVNLNLVAGGRRYHALKLLGVSEVYHATTSDPARPGYVLKGEDEKSTLSNLLSEIAENLARADLDWKDQLNLIVKAYRLATSEANSRGEELLKQDFALMIDVDYQELKAAIAIQQDVKDHPTRYENVYSIRGAYAELLKENARYVSQLAAKKTLAITFPSLRDSSDREQVAEPPEVAVDISNFFHNVDGINYLQGLSNETIDHIVTDPDYALDAETLSANSDYAATGVHQLSPAESLIDLTAFIYHAYRTLRPQGFCVFFYDLDHHEKLQRIAKDVGFRVQRWPLIWRKTDAYSNASPQHNFTKDVEYAMVCRKHSAILVSVQTSCVFECGSANVVKSLGHPFAKPFDLWRWIYNAVAIEGQTVCDPFVGCGSSAIAALRCGLHPLGCEIDEHFYNLLLINLQTEYTRLIGGKVKFK